MSRNNLPPAYDPDYQLKCVMLELQKLKNITTVDPMPETFTAMKAMLQKGVARHYTVQNDEFQGIAQVLYYFNGLRLFAFGVEIDESQQPNFN